MSSSRLASAERMTNKRNSTNQRLSPKRRFNGCSAFKKKGLVRRPRASIFPNLRQNLQPSAYEKDLLSFNDGARHYRRAFFCYGYFPDCVRAVHSPFTLGDAQFRNTNSRWTAGELGRHRRWRWFARRKHLCRRRKLRHVSGHLIWYADELDRAQSAN